MENRLRSVDWNARLHDLAREFRYAFRNLRKDSRFSLVAILALALGIGASTIIFSVVYNVFFNAFPYKSPGRLVVFDMRNLANVGQSTGRNYFSTDQIRAFREGNHVLEDLIAHSGIRVVYDNGKIQRFWRGEIVSAGAFDFLGVSPLLGRALSQDDSQPGAPPVFVMNYRLWKQDFGGDPKILGSTFVLDDTPTTLVGIMPLRFNAFNRSFWLPARADQGSHSLRGGAPILARLKPGVSMRTAALDLDQIAHRLQKENPDKALPAKFAVAVQPLIDSLIGNYGKTIYALLAAVLLLLLIACCNVANLLLARATSREREMAMRASLGATRARLIGQLLAESFTLAVVASFVGCALAYFGLKAVVAVIPAGTLPEEIVIRLNAPVLLLSLGASVFTALLCGLAPALHVWRSDLQPRLAGNRQGGGSFRHGRLRAILVVGEVALSIVLLAGAGLLLRSFLVLTRTNLGFDPSNILYFEINPPKSYFFTWSDPVSITNARQKKNALTRQLLDRMRTLPGVRAVAEADEQPPLKYGWSNTIIPGKPHTERWETRFEACSEGYLETLGVPLLRGRFFSADDVTAERLVMVVNQSFALQYFPHQDPLRQQVKLEAFDNPYSNAPHNTFFEVVGIAADYKTRDYDSPSWQNFPEVFFPYSVQNYSWRTFIARTSVNPSSVLNGAMKELQALDPNVGISESGTLEGALQGFYREPQCELAILCTFALIGLALVAIGVFSVLAYSVSLRTHEIGIRAAIGAQPADILRLVLLNGFRLIAAGILGGLAASYALTRFLASQISGVSATDPATFAAVAAIVASAGLAACLVPARRAARLDPLIALRHE